VHAARLVKLAFLFELPVPVEHLLEHKAHGQDCQKNQCGYNPKPHPVGIQLWLDRFSGFDGGDPSG